MYLYRNIHEWLYMSIYVYVYLYISVSMYIDVLLYIGISIYLSIYLSISISISISIYLYIYIYIYLGQLSNVNGCQLFWNCFWQNPRIYGSTPVRLPHQAAALHFTTYSALHFTTNQAAALHFTTYSALHFTTYSKTVHCILLHTAAVWKDSACNFTTANHSALLLTT